MALTENLDVIISFIQNLALLLKLNIKWPEEVLIVAAWFRSLVNFDALTNSLLAKYLLVHVDFRIKFLALNILLPMAVSFTLFFPFKKLKITIWYLAILIAILLIGTCVTLFVTYMQNALPLPWSRVEIYFAFAIALSISAIAFVCCVTIGMIYQLFRHRQIRDWYKRVRRRNTTVDDRSPSFGTQLPSAASFRGDRVDDQDLDTLPEVVRTKRASFINTTDGCGFISQFIFSILCILVGGFGVLSGVYLKTRLAGNDQQFFLIVPFSVFVAIFGFVLGAFTVARASKQGRACLYDFKQFLSVRVLKIVFLILTMFYIPVATSTFSVFNCVQITCPAHYTIQAKDSLAAISYSFNQFIGLRNASICVPCQIANFNNSCPLDMQQALCPTVREYRLQDDNLIPCSGDLYRYWAASLVGLLFIVGAPIVMYCLIRKSSAFFNTVNVEHLVDYHKTRTIEKLQEKYARKGGKAPSLDQELFTKQQLFELKWGMRVTLIPCAIETLYFSYKFKWRYFKLFKIMERLSLSFVNTLVATIISAILGIPWVYSELVVICCNIVIHIVSCIVAVIIRPNTYVFENILLFVSSLLSGVNSIFALVIFITTTTSTNDEQLRRVSSYLSISALIVMGADAILVLVGIVFSFIVFGIRTAYGNWKKLQKNNFKQIQNVITEQKNVSTALNRSTLNIVINFFMVMAVCCVIGLSIVGSSYLVRTYPYTPGREGMMRYTIPAPIMNNLKALNLSSNDDWKRAQSQLHNEVLVPPTFVDDCRAMFDFELVGYDSWQSFTDSCCCSQHVASDLPETYQVELWRCKNGRQKQRYRTINVTRILAEKDYPVTFSGVDIRAFCSKDFAPMIHMNFTIPEYCQSRPQFVGPAINAAAPISDPEYPIHKELYFPFDKQVLALMQQDFVAKYLW